MPVSLFFFFQMSPRKRKRAAPLKYADLVELINIPDGPESEDDLEMSESEEDNTRTSLSSASTSSLNSSASRPNLNTNSHQQTVTVTHQKNPIVIDRLFTDEDDQDWSSSDEEPLQEYKLRKKAYTTDTQNQDIVRDDSELCVSDDDHGEEMDDVDNNSDCDETDWKKMNLEQLNEITKIYEEDGFDVNISPNYFFSIVTPPIEYFERFFDKDVINTITERTNLYAHQKQTKHWTDTTPAEIKALLGIHMLMSLHPLHDETQYWSSNPLYHVQPIADVMPLKRYKKLMECLHINDNSKMAMRGEPGYDKLFKLRPLIERFMRECSVSKSQSIDECMVKFKGRSSLKQYMPMKPVKRGYKVWARVKTVLYEVIFNLGMFFCWIGVSGIVSLYCNSATILFTFPYPYNKVKLNYQQRQLISQER